MQIDISNPALAAALVARMAKEFGETAQANFALDIIADDLQRQLVVVTEHRDACVEANANLRNDLELARQEKDIALVNLGMARQELEALRARLAPSAGSKPKRNSKQTAQTTVN